MNEIHHWVRYGLKITTMGFLANTALVWGNLQNEAHKKDTRGERMNQNASFFIPI